MQAKKCEFCGDLLKLGYTPEHPFLTHKCYGFDYNHDPGRDHGVRECWCFSTRKAMIGYNYGWTMCVCQGEKGYVIANRNHRIALASENRIPWELNHPEEYYVEASAFAPDAEAWLDASTG